MLTPRQRVVYSPIITRPTIRWPKGARVAVWVAPNVEHHDYTPPHNPARDPWPRVPHPDVQQYAIRDYGNRVGFWRYADLMDEFGIRSTMSLNLAVLEHYPQIAEAIRKRNWAIMGHGFYNTRFMYGMTEEEERDFYRDQIETVRRHAGMQMKGMLGPGVTGTDRTPDLMAEAGLIYHTDWVHDDQPVPIKVEKGRLISVPYTWEINDGPLFARHYDGAYFAEIAKLQFDRLYEEGERTGMVYCLAVHPFRIGHPHMIGHLRDILRHITSRQDVWLTTADDIADYYMEHHYDDAVRSATATTRR